VLANELEDLVGDGTHENLGVLEEVDAGADGDAQTLDGGGVGLDGHSARVSLLDENALCVGGEGDEGRGEVRRRPIADVVRPQVQVAAEGDPKLFGRHLEEVFAGDTPMVMDSLNSRVSSSHVCGRTME
jgi:hypothetical protein